MNLRVALVLVALVAPVVQGATTLTAHSSVGVGEPVVPVRFSPGLDGTTTLNAPATRAETTLPDAPTLISLNSLIDVHNDGPAAQDVRLVFHSATGLPRVEMLTVSLSGTEQIVVRDGVVEKASGAPVTIVQGTFNTAGGDLRISKGQQASVRLDVVSTESLTGEARLVERWVLHLSG